MANNRQGYFAQVSFPYSKSQNEITNQTWNLIENTDNPDLIFTESTPSIEVQIGEQDQTYYRPLATFNYEGNFNNVSKTLSSSEEDNVHIPLINTPFKVEDETVRNKLDLVAVNTNFNIIGEKMNEILEPRYFNFYSMHSYDKGEKIEIGNNSYTFFHTSPTSWGLDLGVQLTNIKTTTLSASNKDVYLPKLTTHYYLLCKEPTKTWKESSTSSANQSIWDIKNTWDFITDELIRQKGSTYPDNQYRIYYNTLDTKIKHLSWNSTGSTADNYLDDQYWKRKRKYPGWQWGKIYNIVAEIEATDKVQPLQITKVKTAAGSLDDRWISIHNPNPFTVYISYCSHKLKSDDVRNDWKYDLTNIDADNNFVEWGMVEGYKTRDYYIHDIPFFDDKWIGVLFVISYNNVNRTYYTYVNEGESDNPYNNSGNFVGTINWN